MNTIQNLAAALIFATASAAPGLVFADGKGHDHAKAEPMKSMPMADADMTNAEVRKIDKDTKKITLKHEAIKSLDMPGMTMVFQVKEDTLLGKAKVGDKVRFSAEKIGGAFVVTDIQPAK